jgi:hypothetical protein
MLPATVLLLLWAALGLGGTAAGVASADRLAAAVAPDATGASGAGASTAKKPKPPKSHRDPPGGD